MGVKQTGRRTAPRVVLTPCEPAHRDELDDLLAAVAGVVASPAPAELPGPDLARGPDIAEAKHDPAYERETAAIKERAGTAEAKRRHAFRAAGWTHPNGHPRCNLCGQEEPVGGVCNGEPTPAEAEAWAKRENRDGMWGDSRWEVGKAGRLTLALGESLSLEEAEALLEYLYPGNVYDEGKHPRWPKGTPGGLGGRFMHAGQRFKYKGLEWDVAVVTPKGVWANVATKGEMNAKTVFFPASAVASEKTAENPAGLVVPGVERPAAEKVFSKKKGGGGAQVIAKGDSNITVVDPFVHPETHDPDIPIPDGSPLTEAQWKRFGKIDQERYAQLMERYGVWTSGASKNKVEQLKGEIGAAAVGVVKKAVGEQVGWSTAQTLSGLNYSWNDLSGTSPAAMEATRKKYEDFRFWQAEVAGIIQWDLYNRVRAPDVATFHKSDHSLTWWQNNPLQGKLPLFSGVSQSYYFRDFWADPTVAAPVAIRHVVMANIALSSNEGEEEMSVADQMAYDSEHVLLFSTKNGPPVGFHGDWQPIKQWLTATTKKAAGGELIETLSDKLFHGVPLPEIPVEANITLQGTAGHGWVSPPKAVIAEALALALKHEFSDPAPGGGAAFPANTLDLKEGDLIQGNGGSPNLGTLYMMIADPTDQAFGLVKYKLTDEDGVTPFAGDEAFGSSSNWGSTVKKLVGHVDVPKQELKPSSFNPDAWVLSGELKKVEDMPVGGKFKIGGVVYEIDGGAQGGKVKIKVAADVGSVKAGTPGTVDVGYKTEPLKLIPGYTESGAPAFEPTAWFTGQEKHKLGDEVLAQGDVLKAGSTYFEVDAVSADGGFSLKALTGANAGKPVKAGPFSYVKMVPKPPGWEAPAVGDTLAYSGKKATVTKIQADGTVWINLHPGKVKLGPEDPAFAGIFSPGKVELGAKTKLKDMAPGQKFHGGTGGKIRPYLVVAQHGKTALVANLDTGEQVEMGAQKSFVLLQAKTAAAVPDVEEMKPEQAFDPSAFDLSGWQPSGKQKGLAELEQGDLFLNTAGKAYAVEDAGPGVVKIKSLADGSVQTVLTKASPIKYEMLQPVGAGAGATAFDVAAYVKGDEVTLEQLGAGDIWEGKSGQHFMVLKTGQKSGLTAVNLESGKVTSPWKYTLKGVQMHSKATHMIPYAELKAGDPVKLGDLQQGDQFTVGGAAYEVAEQLWDPAEDTGSTKVAPVLAGGGTGMQMGGGYPGLMVTLKGKKAALEALPAPAPVDVESLPLAAVAAFSPKSKSGGGYVFTKAKHAIVGQVLQDKAGKLWKVKDGGPTPVLSDGDANFKADGDANLKVVAEPFVDGAPALDGGALPPMMPAGGKSLGELGAAPGDYMTSAQYPHTVWKVLDVDVSGGTVQVKNLAPGDGVKTFGLGFEPDSYGKPSVVDVTLVAPPAPAPGIPAGYVPAGGPVHPSTLHVGDLFVDEVATVWPAGTVWKVESEDAANPLYWNVSTADIGGNLQYALQSKGAMAKNVQPVAAEQTAGPGADGGVKLPHAGAVPVLPSQLKEGDVLLTGDFGGESSYLYVVTSANALASGKPGAKLTFYGVDGTADAGATYNQDWEDAKIEAKHDWSLVGNVGMPPLGELKAAGAVESPDLKAGDLYVFGEPAAVVAGLEPPAGAVKVLAVGPDGKLLVVGTALGGAKPFWADIPAGTALKLEHVGPWAAGTPAPSGADDLMPLPDVGLVQARYGDLPVGTKWSFGPSGSGQTWLKTAEWDKKLEDGAWTGNFSHEDDGKLVYVLPFAASAHGPSAVKLVWSQMTPAEKAKFVVGAKFTIEGPANVEPGPYTITDVGPGGGLSVLGDNGNPGSFSNDTPSLTATFMRPGSGPAAAGTFGAVPVGGKFDAFDATWVKTDATSAAIVAVLDKSKQGAPVGYTYDAFGPDDPAGEPTTTGSELGASSLAPEYDLQPNAFPLSVLAVGVYVSVGGSGAVWQITHKTQKVVTMTIVKASDAPSAKPVGYEQKAKGVAQLGAVYALAGIPNPSKEHGLDAEQVTLLSAHPGDLVSQGGQAAVWQVMAVTPSSDTAKLKLVAQSQNHEPGAGKSFPLGYEYQATLDSTFDWSKPIAAPAPFDPKAYHLGPVVKMADLQVGDKWVSTLNDEPMYYKVVSHLGGVMTFKSLTPAGQDYAASPAGEVTTIVRTPASSQEPPKLGEPVTYGSKKAWVKYVATNAAGKVTLGLGSTPGGSGASNVAIANWPSSMVHLGHDAAPAGAAPHHAKITEMPVGTTFLFKAATYTVNAHTVQHGKPYTVVSSAAGVETAYPDDGKVAKHVRPVVSWPGAAPSSEASIYKPGDHPDPMLLKVGDIFTFGSSTTPDNTFLVTATEPASTGSVKLTLSHYDLAAGQVLDVVPPTEWAAGAMSQWTYQGSQPPVSLPPGMTPNEEGKSFLELGLGVGDKVDLFDGVETVTKVYGEPGTEGHVYDTVNDATGETSTWGVEGHPAGYLKAPGPGGPGWGSNPEGLTVADLPTGAKFVWGGGADVYTVKSVKPFVGGEGKKVVTVYKNEGEPDQDGPITFGTTGWKPKQLWLPATSGLQAPADAAPPAAPFDPAAYEPAGAEVPAHALLGTLTPGTILSSAAGNWYSVVSVKKADLAGPSQLLVKQLYTASGLEPHPSASTFDISLNTPVAVYAPKAAPSGDTEWAETGTGFLKDAPVGSHVKTAAGNVFKVTGKTGGESAPSVLLTSASNPDSLEFATSGAAAVTYVEQTAPEAGATAADLTVGDNFQLWDGGTKYAVAIIDAGAHGSVWGKPTGPGGEVLPGDDYIEVSKGDSIVQLPPTRPPRPQVAQSTLPGVGVPGTQLEVGRTYQGLEGGWFTVAEDNGDSWWVEGGDGNEGFLTKQDDEFYNELPPASLKPLGEMPVGAEVESSTGDKWGVVGGEKGGWMVVEDLAYPGDTLKLMTGEQVLPMTLPQTKPEMVGNLEPGSSFVYDGLLWELEDVGPSGATAHAAANAPADGVEPPSEAFGLTTSVDAIVHGVEAGPPKPALPENSGQVMLKDMKPGDLFQADTGYVFEVVGPSAEHPGSVDAKAVWKPPGDVLAEVGDVVPFTVTVAAPAHFLPASEPTAPAPSVKLFGSGLQVGDYFAWAGEGGEVFKVTEAVKPGKMKFQAVSTETGESGTFDAGSVFEKVEGFGPGPLSPDGEPPHYDASSWPAGPDDEIGAYFDMPEPGSSPEDAAVGGLKPYSAKSKSGGGYKFKDLGQLEAGEKFTDKTGVVFTASGTATPDGYYAHFTDPEGAHYMAAASSRVKMVEAASAPKPAPASASAPPTFVVGWSTATGFSGEPHTPAGHLDVGDTALLPGITVVVLDDQPNVDGYIVVQEPAGSASPGARWLLHKDDLVGEP